MYQFKMAYHVSLQNEHLLEWQQSRAPDCPHQPLLNSTLEEPLPWPSALSQHDPPKEKMF